MKSMEWKHLDNEKPKNGEVCLVYAFRLGHQKAIYNRKLDKFFGQYHGGWNVRWWARLTTPRKSRNKNEIKV